MTQRVNFCHLDVLEIDRCTFEQPDTINRFFYFTPMQFLSSNLHIKKKKIEDKSHTNKAIGGLNQFGINKMGTRPKTVLEKSQFDVD